MGEITKTFDKIILSSKYKVKNEVIFPIFCRTIDFILSLCFSLFN